MICLPEVQYSLEEDDKIDSESLCSINMIISKWESDQLNKNPSNNVKKVILSDQTINQSSAKFAEFGSKNKQLCINSYSTTKERTNLVFT